MNKRIFDVILSCVLLLFFAIFIGLAWIGASIDTRSNGFFIQERIGQFGKPFAIYKLKTMDKLKRISGFGYWLRKSKIDELPQLWNVLIGDMSFVGPRPDIPGYYDKLEGEERNILKLRPGITSDASLKYRNEEFLLAQQENPLRYNDEVIFPDKVKMNLEYYYNRSFLGDLRIIIKTFIRI